MKGRLLWQIGAASGMAPELVDNYREPGRVGDVVWRVGRTTEVVTTGGTAEVVTTGQRWPSFHASEADPAAGYRPTTYAVQFKLADEPEAGYLLRLHYLVITPRYGHVAVAVNGVSGRLYLRPAPAHGRADGALLRRAGRGPSRGDGRGAGAAAGHLPRPLRHAGGGLFQGK